MRVRCHLEPHCCVTVSLPISAACSLFTYSCNPPVSCLGTQHFFRLCNSPICSFWTWTLVVSDVRLHSSLFVTLTLGSHSPCVSHLNRLVLAATSLVWPVILAHRSVPLGNVIRRTCLLHSTFLLNTEASSNQLLLFAEWVIL